MSLWVYPILNELSFMYRGLFFLGSTLFNIGLYFIGDMYTLYLTSKSFMFTRIDLSHRSLGLRVDKAERTKKKY